MYISHFVVHLKLTQYFKSTIFQLKKLGKGKMACLLSMIICGEHTDILDISI